MLAKQSLNHLSYVSPILCSKIGDGVSSGGLLTSTLPVLASRVLNVKSRTMPSSPLSFYVHLSMAWEW